MKNTLHFHDGRSDFPHGAGPSERGWYVYHGDPGYAPPNGPYATKDEAEKAAGIEDHSTKMDKTLRIVIADFQARFGQPPICVLLHADTPRERWFVYHPAKMDRPFASVDKDGKGYEHV